MKVKICGLTNPEDAITAVEAGADYIGVIVDVPVETPRKITLQQALNIKKAISATPHKLVAVIMPKTAQEAKNIFDALRPDAIQLHGTESPKLIRDIKSLTECEIIKAIHVRDKVDLGYLMAVEKEAGIILVDTQVGEKVGGTGSTHDIRLDLEIKAKTKKSMMLSGGLTPENVRERLEQIRPYGVDTSSGVESAPGIKDPVKILKFISEAKCH